MMQRKLVEEEEVVKTGLVEVVVVVEVVVEVMVVRNA